MFFYSRKLEYHAANCININNLSAEINNNGQDLQQDYQDKI